MDLYFAPLSCSLASRMALYESGQDAGFHEVVLSTKKTTTGEDFLKINPKGQVPTLDLGDGRVLTENAAILQYIADQAPGAGLVPAAGTFERYQVQQWLSFVGSELHKQVFYTVFNPFSPPEARQYAIETALPQKYQFLSAHLEGREFLATDQFTVADAYLTTTLNWPAAAGIDLSPWPVLTAYHGRMMQRPAVARATQEELALRQKAS